MVNNSAKQDRIIFQKGCKGMSIVQTSINELCQMLNDLENVQALYSR
jgi:hypothetical protein